MWTGDTKILTNDEWRRQRIPNFIHIEYAEGESLEPAVIQRFWTTQKYGISYRVRNSRNDYCTIRWNDIQCVKYIGYRGYVYSGVTTLYYSPIPNGTLVRRYGLDRCILITHDSIGGMTYGIDDEHRTVEFYRHNINGIMTYEYAISEGLWRH